MTTRPLTPVTFGIVFVLAGCVAALQAQANGELTHHLGNGVLTAVWSFTSAFFVLCVIMLASPKARAGLHGVRSALRSGSLPWWAVPSGLLGAVYVTCQSITAALIGVALFTTGMVAGQVSNSLLVDRFGLGPVGRVPISLNRVVGAGLALVAVALAATGKVQVAGIPPMAAVLAVLAGALVAVQQSLNGRVSVAAGNPVTATWISFGLGTMAMWCAGIVAVATGATVEFPSDGPWWMFLGGLLGVTFVITASWAVPRIGVLVFGLITIAGQLTASLILELVAPLADPGAPVLLFVGAVLTFIGVAIGSRPSGKSRVLIDS